MFLRYFPKTELRVLQFTAYVNFDIENLYIFVEFFVFAQSFGAKAPARNDKIRKNI